LLKKSISKITIRNPLFATFGKNIVVLGIKPSNKILKLSHQRIYFTGKADPVLFLKSIIRKVAIDFFCTSGEQISFGLLLKITMNNVADVSVFNSELLSFFLISL